MKSIFTISIILITTSLIAQDNKCDETLFPYWANGINSKVEGELPRVRQVFDSLVKSKNKITQKSGFITLQIHVSSEGEICDVVSFEIDQNYNPTNFNNGALSAKLRGEISNFSWISEKPFKTYNLIRFKIKNGYIAEIF